MSQIVTAPSLTVNQCYGYDSLNRLTSAEEKSGGTTCAGTQQWKQAFTYDRFGNRNFDLVNTTPNVLGPNPTVSQSTNRIAGQNYGYDSAGNLTSDPTTPVNGIVYDAENRQTQYTKSGQATNSYYYDGDGHRIKKIDSTGTTVFVYNAGGQLIAEYTAGNPSSGGTSYLTTDHLGSTRVMIQSDGTTITTTRHDFLPFGEEIQVGIGGRTSGQGYVADSVRQKFSQKERDIESGLDYFLARYYSLAQGRFTSPDEFSGGPRELVTSAGESSVNPVFYAEIHDPQSLNKYSYCYNNPLRYVDPDGHMGDGNKTLTQRLKEAAAEAAAAAGQAVKDTAVGMGKEAANTVIDASEMVNAVVDTVISPFTNFRFGGRLQKLEPSTPGENSAMTGTMIAAFLIPGSGEATASAKAGELVSAIGKDKSLVRLAEQAGAGVQKGIDALTSQLAKGNLNPGMGTKNLFGDISYARARDGARVFFRQVEGKIEILAKASKRNEQAVIERLKKLYR